MNRKYSIVPFVIVIGIFIYLIYYFPVQRYFSHKKFEQYIVAQGTSLDNIKSKTILKDYKIGGYSIVVKYKDDPDFTYDYTYFPSGEMICIVYDKNNVSSVNEKVKYLPLE